MKENFNMRIKSVLCAALTGGSIFMSGCSANNENNQSKAVESTAETTVTTVQTEVTYKDPSEYGKVIALTFDDGPAVVTTNQVLDAFEKYNARGSFFLVGNNISEGTADTVKRAFDMGCEINSHSRTHSNMAEMSKEDIIAEMEYTDEKIIEITGVKPRFFRPPYISVNDTMFEAIDKPFINSFGSNDWDEAVSSEEISEKVLAQAQDGAIILLHDMQGNDRTVTALDTIIPALQEQGYELVTVGELFHAKGIEPSTDKILYSTAQQTTMY